jgi:hypothetical protein
MILIGVVYISQDHFTSWNDGVYDLLNNDILKIRNKHRNAEIMIFGDFNADLRTPTKRPSNYKHLEKFILSHDLTIMNHSEKCEGTYTWQRNGARSVIDYLLTSENVSNRIMNMTIDDVGRFDCSSDHNVLLVSVNIARKSNKAIKGKQCWKLNNVADWSFFQESLHDKLTKCNLSQDKQDHTPEQTAYDIQCALRDAGLETVGLTNGYSRKPNGKCSWMDEELRSMNSEIYRLRRSLRTKNSTDPTTETIVLKLKSLRNEYARKARSKQQASDLAFIKRLKAAGKDSSKLFWSTVRPKAPQPVVGSLKSDNLNSEAFGTPEIKNLISEVYTATFKSADVLLDESQSDSEPSGTDKKLFSLTGRITCEEVALAIKDLKTGRIGPDNIPSDFIINAKEELIPTLTTLFNKILDENSFPESWKSGNTTLIHKGGRRDIIENYRPITTSSAIGKLFMLIITKRLSSLAEKEGWLGEYQMGFRKNRCTTFGIPRY